MIAPIFRKIAAQVDGEPCCRYMGPDGAGHYVKMVHNGIEYGDMQLICEAYAILKNVLGLEAEDLADIFAQWNRGDLDSYLIEITAQIFRKIDPDTGKPLVDVILDKAGQKGTGLWTLQSALSQSVVISTINAAVEARVISSRKEERVAASKILPQPQVPTFSGNRDELIQAVHDALYASKIVSYAQGMELLGAASTAYNWNLNFGDIATIWRGGCIIRAKFLNRINEAYERDPTLHNLLLDQYFTDIIARTQENWRVAISTAIKHGVAAPAFSASLAYFDSYRPRGCLRICSRRSATSSARTPTSASTSRAFSTPSGWDQPAQETPSRNRNAAPRRRIALRSSARIRKASHSEPRRRRGTSTGVRHWMTTERSFAVCAAQDDSDFAFNGNRANRVPTSCSCEWFDFLGL